MRLITKVEKRKNMNRKFQPWKIIVIVISVTIAAVSVLLRLTDLISVNVFGWGIFIPSFLLFISFPDFFFRIIGDAIDREVHGDNYRKTRIETYLPERKRKK